MPKREVYEFNREKEREHQAKLRLDGVSDTKTRNEISFDKEKCKIELLSTFGWNANKTCVSPRMRIIAAFSSFEAQNTLNTLNLSATNMRLRSQCVRDAASQFRNSPALHSSRQ